MARTACKLSLLVALSFFLAFSAAWADGNELLNNCNAALRVFDNQSHAVDDLTKAGFCLGYISGARDTLIFWQLTSPDAKRVCFPVNVSIPQLIRVVVKYLNENPKDLNMEEIFLVLPAFKNAFPCKD